MSKEAALYSNNSTNVRVQGPTSLRRGFRLLSRLSPRLTSRVAARLFTHPHGARRLVGREQSWRHEATPFRLECGGRSLAAWSWGDGPTILLHHGWNGQGAQLGAFVDPLVQVGFSVVAYDAPAHGESPGRFTNGVELSRTIAEAARQLHGLRGIVAHSLGCLATAYALRRPLPVERIVFLSPPADMITYTRMFADTVGLSERAYELMCEHFEMTLAMDWNDFSAEHLAQADRRHRDRQTPLLVVHDQQDRQVPWQHGRRYSRAWSGSEMLLTKGLGHRRILRDEQVTRKVVDFLVGG
jgi:pimeloyl-ACP methyl ester carboxylesterase